MTVEKWLSDVYYDEWGTHIWNKVDADGGSQLIADIRGWGAIQNLNKEDAEQFQDQVGKFIVEAIREKIARTSSQTISDEEIDELSKEYYRYMPDNEDRLLGFKEGIKHYCEQIKTK